MQRADLHSSDAKSGITSKSDKTAWTGHRRSQSQRPVRHLCTMIPAERQCVSFLAASYVPHYARFCRVGLISDSCGYTERAGTSIHHVDAYNLKRKLLREWATRRRLTRGQCMWNIASCIVSEWKKRWELHTIIICTLRRWGKVIGIIVMTIIFMYDWVRSMKRIENWKTKEKNRWRV